jgi:membrane-associated phospholipid phosphatase
VKKLILSLSLAALFCVSLYAQTEEPESAAPSFYPLTMVFHDVGWNALSMFTYNYGLNFVGSGLGTWGFIASGIDWKWRNVAYDREWLAKAGSAAIYIGYLVPAFMPVGTYVLGRVTHDEKLQVAGLALIQSLALSLAMQTSFKLVTGRTTPGIITELDHVRSTRTDDFSGEFKWFNKNFVGGWPSGHVATAISAVAALSEIYKDNIWLKIGGYTYAAFIGIGVSLNAHWISDVFAGALIGYGIGKTVGRSFNKLLEKGAGADRGEDTVSVFFTPNAIGVKVAF